MGDFIYTSAKSHGHVFNDKCSLKNCTDFKMWKKIFKKRKSVWMTNKQTNSYWKTKYIYTYISAWILWCWNLKKRFWVYTDKHLIKKKKYAHIPHVRKNCCVKHMSRWVSVWANEIKSCGGEDIYIYVFFFFLPREISYTIPTSIARMRPHTCGFARLIASMHKQRKSDVSCNKKKKQIAQIMEDNLIWQKESK